MLREDELLTSRLAIVIYRVVTLDAKASIVKIGRYFHEKIGSKSKTYNPNHPRIKLTHTDLKNKSFKGYDLRVNEKEISIRREIAGKLKYINLEELDNLTISLITGISEEEIKKL